MGSGAGRSTLVTLLLMVWLGAVNCSAQNAITCSPPAEAKQILKRQSRYLIFGELHGTAESPAAFGEVVCAAVVVGKPVVVVLEFRLSSSRAFEKYLSSSGNEKDVDDLLRRTNWDSPTQDGRTSVAMFELFERLRRLRAAGLIFHTVGLVRQPKGPLTQAEHEKGMAEQLGEFAKHYPKSRLFVLVGELHARKRKVGDGGENLASMAALLPPAEVASTRFVVDGGTAWVCLMNPDDTPSCGERAFDPAGRSRTFLGFDYTIFLGRVSASPPMWNNRKQKPSVR